jgi:hypothetical protein
MMFLHGYTAGTVTTMMANLAPAHGARSPREAIVAAFSKFCEGCQRELQLQAQDLMKISLAKGRAGTS